MSSNEQFEREFEAFLRDEDSRIAALYRKLPRLEPDAKLDAAVLAMARRAAATAPPAPRARAPRWVPVLSIAAVMVLAAGITFRIGPQVWQRDTRTLQKAVEEPAASGAAVPAPAPAAPPTPAAPMQKPRQAQSETFKSLVAPKPMAQPAAQDDAVPPAPAPAPPEPLPVPKSPAAAPSAGSIAPRQDTAAPVRKMEPAIRHVEAPAPQAFPGTETLEQEKKSTELDAAAAASDTAAQAGMRKDGFIRRDQQLQSLPAETPVLKKPEDNAGAPVSTPSATAASVPPPAAAPVSAPTAAAAPPPPPLREEAGPAPVTTSTHAQAPAAGGAPAESPLAAPMAKSARLAPVRSSDPNAKLYPEHWLANIRTMLRDNKRDEALRSLGEFRKMYPDYHLPDDLRDLK